MNNHRPRARSASVRVPSSSAFQRTIYRHYRTAGRNLPWRQTKDPYAILVSEVMLQQTQVSRVLPKYKAFLKRFPTLRSLAQAPRSDVLRLWQGLGYNRRGKVLHDTARLLAKDHEGKIPKDAPVLQTFPGIGPYTASAVCVFAFNKPEVMIETNIRTVFIHFFFSGRKKVHDAELAPLIEKTMDSKNPRRWYSALMDYGAYLKESGKKLNAKSAHYVRQTPFRGSRRELRGLLVRLASRKKGATMYEAKRASGRAQKEILTEIDTLVSEGLLAFRKGKITLPA